MVRAVLPVLIALTSATPALACDCMRLDPSFPRFEADLDRLAEYYPVAVEGIIQVDGQYCWRLIPTWEFRGPGLKSYSIDLISDCSLAPDEMNTLIGRRIFALLAEGPGDHRGRYELSRCVNLQSPEVEKAIRKRIGEGCRR